MVIGVREPVVDGLNKCEILASRATHLKQLKKRCNVIVVGDSLADAKVADQMTSAKAILKIGFFVHKEASD